MLQQTDLHHPVMELTAIATVMYFSFRNFEVFCAQSLHPVEWPIIEHITNIPTTTHKKSVLC